MHPASVTAMWCAALFVLAPHQGAAQGEAAQDEAAQNELVRLYSEARAAEAAGRYPAAAQRYERIVAMRPDMAEAHANLGNLYYVQGHQDRAEVSFRKALRLKPGLAAPRLLLGVIHFNRGELDQAASQLAASLKLEPANAMAQLYLGYTHYARKNYSEAVRFLEKTAEQDGGNADAWYHLSMAYGQLSRQYLERLQTEFAGAFETHLVRAHFQESAGNWVDARNELSLALAQQPENHAVRGRIEWLGRRAAGETPQPPSVAPAGEPAREEDGATRYLYHPPSGAAIQSAVAAERSEVVEAGKNLPSSGRQALYRLAEGYQALSFLSSLWVLQTGPGSYRAHQLRAQSLEAAGRLDEAVAEYREVLARKPDLRTIHFAIGNLYWRKGRPEEALPELEAELKLNPRDAQAHYEIADIHFSNGQTAAAEKHFEEAIRYAPAMPEAHLALERIASAAGKVDKALLHLKKVAAISPRDPTPHYRLWILYRRLGKPAEAQAARQAFEERRKSGGGASAEGSPIP